MEYAGGVELDPDDAEALAHVGYILYIGERLQEALGGPWTGRSRPIPPTRRPCSSAA